MILRAPKFGLPEEALGELLTLVSIHLHTANRTKLVDLGPLAVVCSPERSVRRRPRRLVRVVTVQARGPVDNPLRAARLAEL
jgi:hypothetical protein